MPRGWTSIGLVRTHHGMGQVVLNHPTPPQPTRYLLGKFLTFSEFCAGFRVKFESFQWLKAQIIPSKRLSGAALPAEPASLILDLRVAGSEK